MKARSFSFHLIAVLSALLLSSAVASAQDIGAQWLDKIHSQIQKERPPLDRLPFEIHPRAGCTFQYDTNVYFEEEDEHDDSIWIPFAGIDLAYTEPNFDAIVDLMGNYKHYVEEDDASDTEGRFFGKIRYAGAALRAELAQIVQYESDPINLLLLERAERLHSTTAPRIAVELWSGFALEAGAQIEIVRFEEEPLDLWRDNISYLPWAGIAIHLGLGFEAVAGAGYYAIDYDEDPPVAPPDVSGMQVTAGLRGELQKGFFVEIYGGAGQVETDEFFGTTDTSEHSTGIGEVRIRWELAKDFTCGLNAAREFSYLGFGEPWQVTNFVDLWFDYEFIRDVSLRVSGQHSIGKSAFGFERTYSRVAGILTWVVNQYLSVDGGATWRSGEVDEGEPAPVRDFTGVVGHMGVTVRY